MAVMNIEKIKFNDLKPSEYNPRKIKREEMKQLQKNLEEFGLVDPIIINLRNNHIIGGHQRYTALLKNYKKNKQDVNPEMNLIRLGDIGWVFETENLSITSDVNEKALNLSLNKIRGEWDYDKLGLLFEELDKPSFDISLTGFNDMEIEQIKVPDNLKDQFTNLEDIKEGKAQPTFNEENILGQSGVRESLESDDDVLVDEKELEQLKKYKCPKCGYEW